MQWFRLRKQDVLLDEITDMGLDPQTCKIGQVLSAFTRQSHKGRLESAMVEWLRTATAPGPVRRRKLWEFLTPDGSFALPLVITHSEVCLRQRAFEHHDYVSVTVNEDEGGRFLLKGGFGVAWLAAFSVLHGCCSFFVLVLRCCLVVDPCFLQRAFCLFDTCCIAAFAFAFLPLLALLQDMLLAAFCFPFFCWARGWFRGASGHRVPGKISVWSLAKFPPGPVGRRAPNPRPLG